MPISKKQFVNDDFNGRHKTSQIKKEVRAFMQKNRQTAYTVQEVADKLGLKKWSITLKITELRKEGVLEHKAPYWIWKQIKTVKKKSNKPRSYKRRQMKGGKK